MDEQMKTFFEENQPHVFTWWSQKLEDKQGFEQLKMMPEENQKQFVDMLVDDFLGNAQPETLSGFVSEQMAMGWSIQCFIDGLKIYKKVLVDLLEKQASSGSLSWEAIREASEWFDSIMSQFVKIYTDDWEDKVNKQQLAIKELSAPLIPVMEGITVMPLIGTIDTERANYIMENLLGGVVQFESQVVLIDITGVPVVDTMVAQHIIKAAESVRLIGADCILVGIRPEIAQTIVNLGIDLERFSTKSSLRKGIVEAMSRTGRKIVSSEE